MTQTDCYVLDVTYHIAGDHITVPFTIAITKDTDLKPAIDAYFEDSYTTDTPDHLDYGTTGDGIEITNIRRIDHDTFNTLSAFNPTIAQKPDRLDA